MVWNVCVCEKSMINITLDRAVRQCQCMKKVHLSSFLLMTKGVVKDFLTEFFKKNFQMRPFFCKN